MDLREAKVIADGIVRSSEKSAERIADAMVRSSEKSAKAMIKSSERIGERMVESSRIIADRNAQTLLEGFLCVASSLSGTKAELMMDCLKMEADGGALPKVGSRKWSVCKVYTQNILKEFNGKQRRK
jgi:hypothetical protein